MKLVNVLISTYNGASYIEEQVASIETQTYPNIKIYVRDDGSSDGTLEILSTMEKAGRITLLTGNNLGFGPSFMTLLQEVSEGDYWAFCDQDDVWMPQKLEWAIEWLELQNDSKPNMFHSAYYLTDEELRVEGSYLPPTKPYTFQKSITEVLHMGFSSVINTTMRNYMLRGDISRITSHDHWAELIIMKYGNVYFDSREASYHRRLTYSLSGSSMKARLRWLKGALKGNSEILPTAQEFIKTFGDENSSQDSDFKILSWFCTEHYSFFKSLKKCFYYKRWRTSFSSELVVRFLMLIGKI